MNAGLYPTCSAVGLLSPPERARSLACKPAGPLMTGRRPAPSPRGQTRVLEPSPRWAAPMWHLSLPAFSLRLDLSPTLPSRVGEMIINMNRLIVVMALSCACTVQGPASLPSPLQAGTGLVIDGGVVSNDRAQLPAGPAGSTGPAGAAGATGPAGPAGAAEAVGPQGPTGLPVVTSGGNQITVNGIFCGATGSTSGIISDPTGTGAIGYRAAKLACQLVAGCGPSSTAHMCDAGEMVRTSQLGAFPAPAASTHYWYSSGVYSTFTSGSTPYSIDDCSNWTVGASSRTGVSWDVIPSGANGPTADYCNASNPIACCK